MADLTVTFIDNVLTARLGELSARLPLGAGLLEGPGAAMALRAVPRLLLTSLFRPCPEMPDDPEHMPEADFKAFTDSVEAWREENNAFLAIAIPVVQAAMNG